MPGYLVETQCLLAYVNGVPSVERALQKKFLEGRLYLSIVSHLEIDAVLGASFADRLDDLIVRGQLKLIGLDAGAYHIWRRARQHLRMLQCWELAIICTTALDHGYTLLTQDRRCSGIPDLRCEVIP